MRPFLVAAVAALLVSSSPRAVPPATHPSRGQLAAEDVAYILTGIANAPGGAEAIRQIMGAP